MLHLMIPPDCCKESI